MAAIDRCRNRSGPKGPRARRADRVRGSVLCSGRCPHRGGDGTRGEVANRNPPKGGYGCSRRVTVRAGPSAVEGKERRRRSARIQEGMDGTMPRKASSLSAGQKCSQCHDQRSAPGAGVCGCTEQTRRQSLTARCSVARGWRPTGWLTPVAASPGRKGPPSARAGPRFGCLLGSARGHGTGPAFGRVQWSSSPDWIGNPPAAQDRGSRRGDAPPRKASPPSAVTGQAADEGVGPCRPCGPWAIGESPSEKIWPPSVGPTGPAGPAGPAALPQDLHSADGQRCVTAGFVQDHDAGSSRSRPAAQESGVLQETQPVAGSIPR